jgi:uncharacterized peroxidase-related enzyme
VKLDVLNLETAPEESREILSQVQKKFGFVPNLMGVLANAPSALRAYLSLGNLFAESSLTPIEQQVVLLTVSAVNGCDYCVAAHSAMARMQKVPGNIVAALREERKLEDQRLEALRMLAAEIVAKRGWPSADTVQLFLEAGFSEPQVLEVILGVTMKTLSNYTNHISATPVDPQFS